MTDLASGEVQLCEVGSENLSSKADPQITRYMGSSLGKDQKPPWVQLREVHDDSAVEIRHMHHTKAKNRFREIFAEELGQLR